MVQKQHILYYSTNTRLAYALNKDVYHDRHFVYCTPYLYKHPDVNFPPPAPSSSPLKLYERFDEESKSNDRKPLTILGNKAGLIRGAKERFMSKVIDRKTRDDVIKLIEGAPNQEFSPILYVIPAIELEDILIEVPYNKRGTLLYEEYIIENLKECQFDTIPIKYE